MDPWKILVKDNHLEELALHGRPPLHTILARPFGPFREEAGFEAADRMKR